ncbi:MAG: bacterial Ig-like domain-containing protein [Clostridia bacterium]|nr:bacterial Ig-like domain-containing protein [Clostridia bacterium]
MKKRVLCAGMALAMTLSSIGAVPAFAAIDTSWIVDWTGKDGSNNFNVTTTADNRVVMENTKVNNGKFSDGEDSIIYYAKEFEIGDDFEISAKVTIDEYNTMDESSNPQQGSVGIAVLDSLYHKTDSVSYDDGVFLGTYAESKNDDLTFRAVSRNSSDKKEVGDALSDPISNTGSNLGTYTLSIKKVGNAYTLTCGDKSQVVEMTSLEDTIYPCLYIARNVKATFSNVKAEKASKKPASMKIEGSLKTDYTYGDSLDLTGAKVVVTYNDGTSEEVKDYLVKGYNPKRIGKQTVTLVKGNAKTDFTVEVKNLEVKSIDADYLPLKSTYAKGDIFKTEGMQISCSYADGTSEILDSDKYILKIDGKVIEDGTPLSNAGKKQVKVYRADEEGISSKVTGNFYININKNSVDSLSIKEPLKKIYYLGDELDTTGMVITSSYVDNTGKTVTEILKPCDYTVSGFDSEKTGDKTVIVTSAANPEISAGFKVNVFERQAERIEVSEYPRTTYGLGQEFNPADMVVSVVYDNGDVEATDNYTVDTSDFNTSVPGTTSVTISAEGFESVTLPITVVSEMKNVWRSATFGQSSGYDKGPESVGVTAENYGTVTGSINVKAWDGAGKITNDHDGMTYYFTQINGNSDFKLSADITVDKYLEHNNDDTKRNGQEAFGIMAKDVVPLEAEDGSITIDPDNAKIDAEGVVVPMNNNKVFASNMVLLGGYSGTGWPSDPNAASYEKNTNINRINLLVRDGVTAADGGGTRKGPYALSSDFPKEGNKYRITLERLNGGLMAKCYNYQTEEAKEYYYYDDSFLTTQNADVAYVGFFASRWAEITVENVDFYESSKATDRTIASNEKPAETAELLFRDNPYSTKPVYEFDLDLDNAKGTVTVKMNDKVVAQDRPISDIEHFKANLNTNTVNKLVAVFTPDDSLNLTSYEPIVIRENIYHKSINTAVTTVYASPEGSFKGNGTEGNPYDIYTAIGFLQPGQTLILKGGTYKLTKPIEILNGVNGTAGNMMTVQAKKGEKVVIDGQNMTAGVILGGDYWHIKDIEFTNCAENQKCFHLGGSHNIIENCIFSNNRDMGLQISRISGKTQPDFDTWPSYNLILNCESYNNCDPSMINADGFGAKLTVGAGNVFRGCKSHHNVDDGWDLYTKVNTGAIGSVTLENCESYRNGWRLNEDGTETPYNAGGNNGFKCGGENVAVQHSLINCTAWGNGNNGVTTNSNPALKLVNVTAYDNNGANIRLYSDKPEEYNYDVQGVRSADGGEPDVVATITQNTEYKNASETPLASEINYWCGSDKTGVNSAGDTFTKSQLLKK